MITELIPASTFIARYPLTWAYLQDNKTYLENREKGKLNVLHWYAYGRSQALATVSLPKIFTPDIAASASYSLDETGDVFFTGGVSGGYGILALPEWSHQFVLGLLNSKLLDWFIRQTATQMRGGYYSYESRFIRNLPIRAIDFSNSADKKSHNQIVSKVEAMLEAKKKLAQAKTDKDKSYYENKCSALDRQIDRLVYDLYDLTDQEIEIVEGTAGS